LAVFIPRSVAQTISCSSDDGKRHYCSANAQGRVRLVQQRSESACREGYSWGSDSRGIWVDHGCRADFAIEEGRGGWDRDHDRDRDHDGYRGGDYGSGAGQVVSCSSDDMHRHYCPADTRGGVQLIKQRSDSACREGYSWGSDSRGIWVDHGCRADFAIKEGRAGWDRDHDRDRDHDGYRGGDSGSGAGRVVSCSSDDMHRHYCPADTRGGVQLIKQHSDSSCRQGRSWGYDQRGIWVDHGCRADFQVGR
jgi:Protein of unknown function (DUF3011)